MGIKDTFRMDEIKRFFSSNSFVSKPLSKISIVRSVSSSNNRRQIQGMRSLVSRMQRGEDMSDLYNDIIKVIDTRNVEFKRLLNLYLVRYTKGWPAKQLICINTLLKDFGDEMSEIRHSAIEDSGFLGDGTILRNYVNPLKMHGRNSSPETRCRVADSLKNYFVADPRLFRDENLHDLLRELVFDSDPGVCTHAMTSAYVVERHLKILHKEEIKRLFDRFNNSGNMEALGGLLGLVRNRPEDFPDTTPLIPLLSSSNLWMFYQASSLLVSMNPSYRQMVFDHLRGFLDSKDEELYSVLDYAESLVPHVHYDNSYFVIYEDDKRYNKIKKLALLFKRLDHVSMSEIRHQCRNPDLTGIILKKALGTDCLMDELLHNPSRTDEIIRTLYEACSISDKWLETIQHFLSNAKDVSEKQKYIYLCGKYVSNIPTEIKDIQSQNIPSLTNELARFYLSLYRRNILSRDALFENLSLLQKNCLAKDKIRMIANTLKTHDVQVFNTFCNLKKSVRPGDDSSVSCALKTARIASDSHTGTNSILDVKPYYGFDRDNGPGTDGRSVSEGSSLSFIDNPGEGIGFVNSMPYDGKLEYMDNSAPPCPEDLEEAECAQHPGFLSGLQEENTWLRFAESHRPERVETFVRLIDTNGLKGLVNIVGNSVVVQVDVVETPLTMYYEHRGQIHSRRVESEGVFPLFKLDLSTINSRFRLTIKRCSYEVFLDIRSFIHPLSCTRDDFERTFKTHTNDIVLDKFDMENVHPVDDTSFAFSILGSDVYGRRLGEKTILKGEREVLNLFLK